MRVLPVVVLMAVACSGGGTSSSVALPPPGMTGLVCKDISANQVMLDFFDAHR